ncbi:hypothetical protein [Henriciella sp.]|uniref:hypothetical protein n=1 Tax=Henriciella sp. TaxID=1968823 RepID=UPI0025BFB37E|nr:hypothetical protein [Henriciella sp.]
MSDTRPNGASRPANCRSFDFLQDRSAVRCAVGVVILLWTVVCLFYLATIFSSSNLMDHYAFRQTQVAAVIRELREGGPWLAYRMPVLGPPWTAPMEFPLYQLIVAGLSNLTGLSLEMSGRLLSLLSGTGCLLLTWRMARLLGLSSRLQILIVLLLALSPMFTYWSQTVMIETFALALCLGMSVCAAEFLENDRKWPLLLGSLLGIAAALTKVTTFVPFALGLFIYFGLRLLAIVRKDWGAWSKHVKRAAIWFAAGCLLLLPGLFLTIAWVDWSDQLKAQSAMTEFLTSDSLARWNYGEIGDFFQSMSYLATSFRDEAPSIFIQSFGTFGVVLFGLSVIGILLRSRHRLLFVSLLVVYLAAPLIFANLYEVHFYYWVATIVFSTVILALGIDSIIELSGAAARRVRSSYALPGAAIAAFLIGALALVGSQHTLHGFFLAPAKHPSSTIQAVGQTIRSNVPENGVVFTFGYNWNPAIQYYADRPMVMARNTQVDVLGWALEQGVVPDGAAFCAGRRSEAEEVLQHPIFAQRGEWTPVNDRLYCIIYVPASE